MSSSEALSATTQGLVAQIITDQAMSIRDCEVQKEVLAQNHSLVVLNAFCRIDQNQKQHINTLDLLAFFRDNGLIVSEADCYMLIKMFDSNGDGQLSLVDLMQILCPRSYTYAKNFRAAKRHFQYGLQQTKLSYDVEYAVLKVIEKEIECLKRVELLKQQLVSRFDYSILSIFRMIDKYSHGVVNSDNMRVFLSQHECAQELEHTDIVNYIKRFDKDVDGGLKFVDLVNALQTMTNYNPKSVHNANNDSRVQADARAQMAEYGIMSGSTTASRMASLADINQPHIQIEDMGGVNNLTNSISNIHEAPGRTGYKSGLASDTVSMQAFAKGGDPSRLGHATRTTEYTSNVGNLTMHEGTTAFDRATSAAAGALSFHAPMPGSTTPTVAGGDGPNIMNYPYSYDQDQKHEVDFAERLYRANHECQRTSQDLYKTSVELSHFDQRQNVLFPSASQQNAGMYHGSRDFAQALCDMCEVEGTLEQKRRELALRSDFNMCDAYKMFTQLDASKRGVDCDDLYATIVQNLRLTITKDEVFIIFYKLDKDGDGTLSYSEICDCFVPRESDYAILINTRGGFYGAESDPKKYFEGQTRELLKRFLRGFVECEVSIELVRQRIINKTQIKLDTAFSAIDKEDKGYITIDDVRSFLRQTNTYPSDKCLRLFWTRLDKNEDGVVSYDEFITALTPLQNNQDAA